MKSRGNQQRGASLASVLVISVLMLTIAMTVLGLGFHNLRQTDRYERGVQAKALADGALAMAVSRLRGNPNFSELNIVQSNAGEKDLSRNLRFEPEDGEGFGQLTFDPIQAQEWGMPLSINNLPHDSSVAEDDMVPAGIQIPPSSAYLVAEGFHNGTRVRVETIVTIPRFPFSMGASGKMVLDDVVIGSVRQGDATTMSEDGFDPKQLLPANLVSNSTAVDGAITLGGESYISGDVIAGGRIDGEGTQIGGDSKPFHAMVDLPKVDVTTYDTDGKPGVRDDLAGSSIGLMLEGYGRSNGNMNIAGPLELDGGVLYVDGDLTVSGGLSGKGAVIVNGSTTISGGGSLSSDGTVALLSQGDLTIMGEGRGVDGTRLSGLVYTEGNLRAENVALEGVLVANGEESETTISGANVTENLTYAEMTISSGPKDIPTPRLLSFIDGGGSAPLSAIGVNATPKNVDDYFTPRQGLFANPEDMMDGAADFWGDEDVERALADHDRVKFEVGLDFGYSKEFASIPEPDSNEVSLGQAQYIYGTKDSDGKWKFECGVEESGDGGWLSPNAYQTIPEQLEVKVDNLYWKFEGERWDKRGRLIRADGRVVSLEERAISRGLSGDGTEERMKEIRQAEGLPPLKGSSIPGLSHYSRYFTNNLQNDDHFRQGHAQILAMMGAVDSSGNSDIMAAVGRGLSSSTFSYETITTAGVQKVSFIDTNITAGALEVATLAQAMEVTFYEYSVILTRGGAE